MAIIAYALPKPLATITSSATGPVTSDFTVSFTFNLGVSGFTAADISVTNGTVSSFSGSDGDTVFTATITPTNSGAVLVDVNADVAQDAQASGIAGNSASSQFSITADLSPQVQSTAFGTVDGVYGVGSQIYLDVTFDQVVTVAGQPKVTLETGTSDKDATFASGSGTSVLRFLYEVQAGDTTADLTYAATNALSLNGGGISNSNGTAVLTLPAPSALASASAVVVDTTVPVVSDANISITGATGTGGLYKVGDTIVASWSATAGDGDENLSGSLGGVSVDFSAFGGGSSVAASLSGTTWSASYTLSANSSVTGANRNVSVTATDEAGNATTQADTSNATVDATPPVVSAANISLSGATGTGGAFKIGDTVTASWNNSAGGDNNVDVASVTVDFTGFGGGAAVAASNSSGTWTAAYTITAGGIDAVNRNASVSATDTTGNVTTTAGADNATVDSQVPSVTDANISISGASGTGGAFKVGDTVTASWNNTAGGDNNADIADVTVDFTQFGGGAAVTATNSSGTWAATYTITSGAIDTNNLNVSVTATDDASNLSTTADTSNAVVDSELPTVVLSSSVSGAHSGPFSVTATFPEVVTGFVIGDVTVGNGIASNFAGSGTTYTFDVTPSADGSVTIDIAADVAVDGVGNGNMAANQLTITSDSTGPTVGLTSNANNPHSGLFTVTATFSEVVTGFVVGDVTVGNGTASNFAGSGTTYTFDVTPSADGAVTIDIAASVAVDVAGNDNSAASQLTVTSDGTGPTVSLTSNANNPHLGLFTVTATFSEVVTGFVIGDVTVGNGIASNFAGSGTTYTFDVTPSADGAVTIDIAADVAQDSSGNGNMASSQLSVMTDGTSPTVTITGPEDGVVSDFTVTFTFSEHVTGFDAGDVNVVNGSKGTFAGSNDVYTLVITNPIIGTVVSVSVGANEAFDAAGNGNEASNVYEVQAGSPAAEFAERRNEIRQVLVEDANRSLVSTLSANQRMTRAARERFVASRQVSEDDVSRDNVPFDVSGSFALSETRLSTRGTFFEQRGNAEATARRLFFGDFDLQHDGDTDSTTATISARMAWEQMYGDATMLGLFVGGEFARSTIKGRFEGEQDRLGFAFGGHAVHQLDEQLFFDGFVSLGAGRNDLEMADDVLVLTSDYGTRTATLGAALSGIYGYGQYELRPELAFSYGKTWIGDVGFTGVAYGLTDDTLSLDAGRVSIATLTLRPEAVWALDAPTVADSRSQLSLAPRVICERVQSTSTSHDCGTGGEIGLTSTSKDGLSNAEFRVIVDKVGNRTRSSLVFNLERQF